MPTWIYSETVLKPEGAGLAIGPASIGIEGSSIVAVQQRRHPQAEVLTDRLIAPAFVNAHTHLAMSAYRGIGGLASLRNNVVEDLYYALESGLEPGDVRAFTLLACAESLLNGVGCVWDHYYFGNEVAEAARISGLSAVVSPTLQDQNGPGTTRLEEQLDATVAIARDASLEEAGVVAALGPHATDTVSGRLWRRIADLASEHQLPLHLHAAQSVDEYRRVMARQGTSPLGWLQREGWLQSAPHALLVHLLYADRADIERLDPERTTLVYCPASQLQYCFPAPVARWRELGRSWVIGTDCGACNDTMNVQAELRLASGPQFGVVQTPAFRAFWEGGDDVESVARERTERLDWARIDPVALLDSVLEGPGRLHPILKVGAIRPGYRANLVAYDLTHPAFWPGTDVLRALALQDAARAISRMMLSGAWLSPDGDHARTVLASDWLAEAREQADARRARLLRAFRS